jgi:peptidyl-tRNA hydrolase, PTH1 family
VVGLGNPGKDYAETRHNIGQMVVERWAADSRSRLSRLKSFGSVAKVSTHPAIYVADTTGYMNVSGPPAKQIAAFYGVPASQLVVIHDDLDLPFGTIRLKFGGGHGGHNGIKSLQAAFASPDFFRVRMGIGRPPGQMDPAKYVLDRFDKDQRTEIPLLLDRAAEAVQAIISEGLTTAQQRYHAQ